MRLLKNSIFCILVISFMLLLNGCFKQKYDDKFNIDVNDIYSQNEDEYLVYFYKDDCKYCKKIYAIIDEYLQLSNDNDHYIKLYVCNITDSEIKRVYEGENGQGTEGRYFVDGVIDVNDLYIAGVPSLIKIDVDDVSYFVTSGSGKIKTYFENIIYKTPTEEE